MFYLLASIVLTSYLTLSFKAVERFGIPVFQAIVFNYITCVVTGSVVNGSFPLTTETFAQPWGRWALLMGCLFVSIFNIIGFTAQKIGVAVASVANKLSLVIPFIFSIVLYKEEATWLKIIGILLAVVAVIFTCWPQKGDETPAHKHLSKALLIIVPTVLFISSGLLDTLVKYVEQKYINENNTNTYFIASFATAATIGTLALLFVTLTGRQKFEPRSIIAGILIGIPNYFSLWTLVKVLKDFPGRSSSIIPVNNMGIVLFSSLVAWILFKERLTAINWIGIILSLGAIALIAFG